MLSLTLALPNLINSTYVLIIHHTYIESSYKTEKIRNKTNKSVLTVWHTSDRVRKKYRGDAASKYIQSTLDISNFQGDRKCVRDNESSTYRKRDKKQGKSLYLCEKSFIFCKMWLQQSG